MLHGEEHVKRLFCWKCWSAKHTCVYHVVPVLTSKAQKDSSLKRNLGEGSKETATPTCAPHSSKFGPDLVRVPKKNFKPSNHHVVNLGYPWISRWKKLPLCWFALPSWSLTWLACRNRAESFCRTKVMRTDGCSNGGKWRLYEGCWGLVMVNHGESNRSYNWTKV